MGVFFEMEWEWKRGTLFRSKAYRNQKGHWNLEIDLFFWLMTFCDEISRIPQKFVIFIYNRIRKLQSRVNYALELLIILEQFLPSTGILAYNRQKWTIFLIRIIKHYFIRAMPWIFYNLDDFQVALKVKLNRYDNFEQ